MFNDTFTLYQLVFKKKKKMKVLAPTVSFELKDPLRLVGHESGFSSLKCLNQ